MPLSFAMRAAIPRLRPARRRNFPPPLPPHARGRRPGPRRGSTLPLRTEIFRFGEFELDRSAYELRRGGTALHLQRIPFQLLSLLVERRGQLVTREEILERIWGKGVFVDSENSINTAVRKIRRTLNDV